VAWRQIEFPDPNASGVRPVLLLRLALVMLESLSLQSLQSAPTAMALVKAGSTRCKLDDYFNSSSWLSSLPTLCA